MSPAVSLSHVYSRRTRYRATPSYLRVASVSRMSQEVTSLASRTRLSSGSTSLACASRTRLTMACASRTRIRQLYVAQRVYQLGVVCRCMSEKGTSLACLSAGLRLCRCMSEKGTSLGNAWLVRVSCESHADNWLRLSNASVYSSPSLRLSRRAPLERLPLDVRCRLGRRLSPVPSRRVDHASLSRSHPFRAIALVSLASRTRYPLVRHRTIVRASHRTIKLTSPVSRGSRR